MKVKCLDHWHELSPTAMAMVIRAFQDGELTRLNGNNEIHPTCIKEALTPGRTGEFLKIYKGNSITFDFKKVL